MLLLFFPSAEALLYVIEFGASPHMVENDIITRLDPDKHLWVESPALGDMAARQSRMSVVLPIAPALHQLQCRSSPGAKSEVPGPTVRNLAVHRTMSNTDRPLLSNVSPRVFTPFSTYYVGDDFARLFRLTGLAR